MFMRMCIAVLVSNVHGNVYNHDVYVYEDVNGIVVNNVDGNVYGAGQKEQ